MRILWVLLLALSSAAHADDWRTEDSARAAVFTALQWADWKQTRYIAEHPSEYDETNPILGIEPTPSEVDRYFTVATIGNIAIAYLLPHEYRKTWQYTTIVISAGYVAHNYSIGISLPL